MHIAKALSLAFIVLVLISGAIVSAQPSIVWQKCLGGSGDDEANSIQQTSDGGFILAGYTWSNDGDVSGHHPGGYTYIENDGPANYDPNYHYNVDSVWQLFSDYWIVKLNSAGDIVWQKCLGGSEPDAANSIQQTLDGGFIVAGATESNDGDVSGNHGCRDFWVVKLDSSGDITWQKCLGGSDDDEASSIQQTSDGGFIVAGYTNSNDGDVRGKHGSWDYWVVKLDSTGRIEWQKCLGGSDWDEAHSIQQTSDGGFIVAGATWSNDGDVRGKHGSWDYWVVKLDSTGDIVWQKCLGGSGYEEAYSVQQTTDGGFIVAGVTRSNDGDVSGNHGDYDWWVVKLDSSGNIVWQKCLGGSAWGDEACSIQQTIDGGFIVAGVTESNDADVSGNHGRKDYWVVKLDSSGDIVWQKCLGGSDDDEAYSIQQTSDGGFIMAGATESNDGDVSENHGEDDFWVVKLSSEFK